MVYDPNVKILSSLMLLIKYLLKCIYINLCSQSFLLSFEISTTSTVAIHYENNYVTKVT